MPNGDINITFVGFGDGRPNKNYLPTRVPVEKVEFCLNSPISLISAKAFDLICGSKSHRPHGGFIASIGITCGMVSYRFDDVNFKVIYENTASECLKTNQKELILLGQNVLWNCNFQINKNGLLGGFGV